MTSSASLPPDTSRLAPVVVTTLSLIFLGFAGGMATEIGPWYKSLVKPSWQPPDWLFGPVWTSIYLFVGIAAVRSWRRASRPVKERMLWLWIINGLLNIIWSVLFFTMKRPDLALLEVFALWLSIAALVIVLGRADRLSGWLLMPYLLWVGFAAYLNYTIAILNRFI